MFLGGFHAIRNGLSDQEIQDMWEKHIQPDLDYIDTQYNSFIKNSGISIDRGKA